MEGIQLSHVLVLIGAAVVTVPLCQFLRLGSVLGFLAAGALVGPSGLEVITDVAGIRHFAELGVVFLLFVIGVELRPARLWRMRRAVFGLGSAQVVVTGAGLAAALSLLGYGPRSAVLVGLALALSSTAFVVQILAERRHLRTEYGRATFGVLLLQDLAVVPLLALVPLLATRDDSVGGDIGLALLEGVAILALVIVLGRFMLRPVFQRVARYGTSEIFAALVVLLVLGAAFLTQEMGLSMAMGAFMAGLLVADSEYRHQIVADIQPFRGFLLGLFFMSVGMSVDLGYMVEEPARFGAMLLGLLGLKAALLWVLCRLFRHGARDSAAIALILAQSGEFAFVIFTVASDAKLLSAAQFQELALVVALSMVVTPLLAAFAERARSHTPAPVGAAPEAQPQRQVLIAGFGRVGRRVADILTGAGVPYTAVERNAERVARARGRGYSVFFGDASRADVLAAAGADTALLAVITLDDITATEQLVSNLRRQFPGLPIHARGHDRAACEELLRLGANVAVAENLEVSLRLARDSLVGAGFPVNEADALVSRVRSQEYARIHAGLDAHAGAAERSDQP